IVRRGVGALHALGLSRGDRAAILSENRIEWPLADFCCLCAGVCDVPIYSTLTAPQIRYILEDAQVSLVFVSTAEQLAKLREALAGSGRDVAIVVFDPLEGVEGVLSWEEFLERGESATADQLRREVELSEPGDLATLIYTSGTTGNPKGVMLTHNNVASNVWACSQVLPVNPDDSSLSFLPLSHVLQRMVDYLFFSQGCVTSHCSIDRVSDEMARIRPTKVVSVPRLYEKVYQRVTGESGLKGRIAGWAVDVGREWEAHVSAGRKVPALLALKHRLADRLVFGKIRGRLGGRLAFFVSGGAPLAPDINRFFFAAGVRILEGYGLTETSPVTNVNTLDHFRIGTVGRPVPGTEIRLAADGEILVRGPQVMKGYYGLPEKTAEVLDGDGWLATGDIGELSEDGYLTITDRKKDLIKTSGGKYIAPQPIENALKKNPFVDQVMVVGEGKNFSSVLVVPAFEQLARWAAGQGIAGAGATLLHEPAVQKQMAEQVFGELGHLARFEMPKKIGLLSEAFSLEAGTLTPTQKVKRREVLARYEALIDAFYVDGDREQTVFVDTPRNPA
ncbi:MAG: long-chain fatty acid--CoA ligase, partial [Gemmatimonadota bacterium]|nr:long-chain fatty acid--CoA ligase [Gemmatimonadota bacterium]